VGVFDARFFEQYIPSCIDAMRENFEVFGEVISRRPAMPKPPSV
jgi:hypothetical protein